jgi:hypothetical protein
MAYKHVNPENEYLFRYRAVCPRHAVTFELAVNEDTRRRLFALTH